MDRSLVISIITSVLLHSSLFFVFLSPKNKNKQLPKQLQAPQATQVSFQSKNDSRKNDFIEMKKMSIQNCPRSYIGVGIKYSMMEITDVSPGSPAERIGLKVGDFILNMTATPLTEIGQDFNLTISRGSQILTFSATAEKICTK